MFQSESSPQHTVAQLSGKLDGSFRSAPPRVPFDVHCASGKKDHTSAFRKTLYLRPDVSAESHTAFLNKLLGHSGKIHMHLAHLL